MPLFYLICPDCAKETKVLKTIEEIENLLCAACNGKLERNSRPPSSVVKEIIDNGLQAKRVEQYSNARELLEERQAKQLAEKNKDSL
jgi:hypothetical protein